MNSELHEVRAVLVQALNKIDTLLAAKPNPHLPVLTAWLKQASQQQTRATQLYVLANQEFALHGLEPLARQDIAHLLRQLGYVNKRTSAGMTWTAP